MAHGGHRHGHGHVYRIYRGPMILRGALEEEKKEMPFLQQLAVVLLIGIVVIGAIVAFALLHHHR